MSGNQKKRSGDSLPGEEPDPKKARTNTEDEEEEEKEEEDEEERKAQAEEARKQACWANPLLSIQQETLLELPRGSMLLGTETNRVFVTRMWKLFRHMVNLFVRPSSRMISAYNLLTTYGRESTEGLAAKERNVAEKLTEMYVQVQKFMQVFRVLTDDSRVDVVEEKEETPKKKQWCYLIEEYRLNRVIEAHGFNQAEQAYAELLPEEEEFRDWILGMKTSLPSFAIMLERRDRRDRPDPVMHLLMCVETFIRNMVVHFDQSPELVKFRRMMQARVPEDAFVNLAQMMNPAVSDVQAQEIYRALATLRAHGFNEEHWKIWKDIQ